MTRLRQTIARRLKEAQNTAAMLTTFNEVDMSAVMQLRSQYRDQFEKRHGVKLGFMGFFVRACVPALKDIPAVNAEIDGGDLIYKNYYHIGVAVGTEKGLVVPVVRDADQKSLAEIEKTIADLGRRARDGAVRIEEMQGGTFTITNGGVYGSLMSTPILNAPQSGILGMHKIQERPMVVAGKIEAAADDVSGAVVRPPHRRWPRGGDVPGAGQGLAGGPGADGAGFVSSWCGWPGDILFGSFNLERAIDDGSSTSFSPALVAVALASLLHAHAQKRGAHRADHRQRRLFVRQARESNERRARHGRRAARRGLRGHSEDRCRPGRHEGRDPQLRQRAEDQGRRRHCCSSPATACRRNGENYLLPLGERRPARPR